MKQIYNFEKCQNKYFDNCFSYISSIRHLFTLHYNSLKAKCVYGLSVLLLTFNGLQAQAPYCAPSFGTGCGIGDQIESFSTTGGITNISNLNSGCSAGNYAFISSQEVTVPAGLSFDFTVESGPLYAQGFRIWVDWENNNSFNDPGNDVWNSGVTGTIFTGTITVPSTVPVGTYRMRVRSNWNALPTDPCAHQDYGEVEDYLIEVVTPPTCMPPSNLTASYTNVSDSADLDWTENSSATTWEVEWGVSGFNPGSGNLSIATSKPFNIAGLVPHTDYEFYVRSVCAPGDTSAWNGPYLLDRNYCTPQFGTGCGIGDQIESFSTTGGLTNISHLNSGCSGPDSYSHITNQEVAVPENLSFDFTVESGPTYDQGFRIWVDWESNGQFTDPGNDVWNSVVTGSSFTGTINIPSNVAPGTYRMRVRSDYGGLPTDPCAMQTYGEAEDYDITVIPPITSDLSLASGEIIRTSECYNPGDTVAVVLTITNAFGPTVDFSSDPLTAHWSVTGPVNSSGTITVNTDTLSPGMSMDLVDSSVVLTQPGTYTIDIAYIETNAFNSSAINDTLTSVHTIEIDPILSVVPDFLEFTSLDDTLQLTALSHFLPLGNFFITEICHWRGSTTGAPPGGWPSYLIADDYIEITGEPNSDLDGITLEQWDGSSMVSTHTFPSGTVLSPNGTAVIAVGQMGASVPSPSDYYYHGNGAYTGLFSSTQSIGRILRDNNGNIIDAVGYGPYTFPAAAGVTPSDWSGNTPAVSSAGNRLEGPYTKNATNWINSGVSPQDPNTVNNNVTVPQPGAISGLEWYFNGVVIDTMPVLDVVYTTPGMHEFVASFNSPCGTFTDTAIVYMPSPLDMAADSVIIPEGSVCGSTNLPVEVAISNASLLGPVDFTQDTAIITVQVSGAANHTFTTSLTDNSLNNNNPLNRNEQLIVTVGNLDISTPGTYYFDASVSMTGDDNPTNDVAPTDSLVIPAVPDPVPVASATAGGPTTFCDGENVLLSAFPDVNHTYQWRESGTIISGAFNNTHSVTSSGNYDVVVTNSYGCSDTSNTIAVTTNPLPSANITPDSAATICDGNTITFHADSASGFSYQWIEGGTAISGENTSIYHATQSGSYSVEITDANGCQATSQPTFLQVDPSPVAEIATPSDTDLCYGQVVQLASASIDANSYQWMNNGSNISGANGSTYFVFATGSYQLIAYHANGCPDTSEAVNINVNPMPNVNVTADGPTTFCEGDDVELSVPVAADAVYQWERNGTAIPGADQNIFNATESGDHRILVTDTTTGCVSTSAEIEVTVNQNPEAVISIVHSTTVCEPGEVLLDAETSGNVEYQWYSNGVEISGADEATYSASASGDYTVTVTGAATGCFSESAPAEITVNPRPEATLTTANGTETCGGTVELNAGTDANFTYNWLVDGSHISGENGSTLHASESGEYQVIVTNEHSCTDTSSAIAIMVHENPEASFTTEDVCQSEAVEFTNTSSISSGDLVYAWDFGDGNTSLDENPSHEYQDAGTYEVSLIATSEESGCNSTATVDVEIYAMPLAAFNAVVNDEEASVTVTPNEVFHAHYAWDFGDGTTSEEMEPEAHQYDSNAEYTITLRVESEHGCVSEVSEIVNIITVSLAGLSTIEGVSMQVYPNPFRDDARIAYNLERASEVSLRVYDMLGRQLVVFAESELQSAGAHHYVLSNTESSLSSGLYLITLTIDGKTITERVSVVE